MEKELHRDQIWTTGIEDIFSFFHSTPDGLSGKEAKRRFKTLGPNKIATKKTLLPFTIYLRQFKSPLILILIVASVFSYIAGDELML